MVYDHIPGDPVMLLSFVNLKLRDEFADLDELCAALMLDKDALCRKLEAINYFYDKTANQFV